MKTRLIFLLFVGILFCAYVMAQPESTVRRLARGKIVGEHELVSFKSDVPYSKAIQAIGELSKKLEGKIIIDRSPLSGKDKDIGIDIESMYWKDAFELILRSNQLWYNDYPEYMEVISFEEAGKQAGLAQMGLPTGPSGISDITQIPARATGIIDSSEYYAKAQEVEITAIFFDINRTKLAEAGLNLSVFRGSDLNMEVRLTGAKNITGYSNTPEDINMPTVGVSPTGLSVTIDALFGALENDKMGEVIARPQMVVRSGQSAQFQVGADFSVLEKDFSGNTIQRFYPTGTILTVKPKVWKIGETSFIDVNYKIEKSSFVTGAGTSIIYKTQASGALLLLDGEESYVGGLFSNEETTVRKGVPFLKDLPWWFFGLRYIFGYNAEQVDKRELIVLLKAEILPTVEERASRPQVAKDIIRDNLKEMEKEFRRKSGK